MEFYIAGAVGLFVWIVYASAIAVRWVRANGEAYWEGCAKAVGLDEQYRLWYPIGGWQRVGSIHNPDDWSSDGVSTTEKPCSLASELPLAFVYAPFRGVAMLLWYTLSWVVWPAIAFLFRLWAFLLRPLLNQQPRQAVGVPYGSIPDKNDQDT